MPTSSRGLAAKYFVDAEIYQQESRQIFEQEWLCLGRASSISSPNDFQTYFIEGQSILAIRTDSGLKAFHNVCRHRGAQLCTEERGSLQNSCLQCPYHAWTYGNDGTLRNAPNMQDAEDFDTKEFGLVELGCAEWLGYIFVNWSHSSAHFAEHFAAVYHHFDPWRPNELRVADQLKYTVDANWKLLFQNFSECYHCPTVHPKLAQLTPYKSATNELSEGSFLGGPMLLTDEAQTMSTDGKFIGPAISGLTNELLRQVGFYTIFPTMLVSPHPDYVMIHRLKRKGPTQTDVVCEFLTEPNNNVQPEGIKRATDFWDEVNREDWHVCELVQRGATTAGIASGPYGPLETLLPILDRNYLRLMG